MPHGRLLAAAVAAVFFATAVFKEIAVINATTVGFAYLITILVIAASWGFAESILASVLATVCFNYFFLPPVRTWVIADPQNLVAWAAFTLTALIAGELSAYAQRRRREVCASASAGVATPRRSTCAGRARASC